MDSQKLEERKKRNVCHCGMWMAEGRHPKCFLPATIEDFEMHYHMTEKCCVCGTWVSLKTIKKQGVENWRKLAWIPEFFCPHCSHLIETSFIP